MRKLTALLVTLGLLVPLAFGLASAAAPTVVSVMLTDFADEDAKQYLNETVVPEFEKSHPGVKVELSWTPWSGYSTVLTTRFAGGVMPDVLCIGAAALGSFASKGMIQPIDKYVRNWSGLRDMVPPAVEDGKIDGVFYSVAYSLDQRTFAWYKPAFEEVGLNSEKPPRTWDEMLAAAKKLVKFDGAGKMIREGFDLRTYYHHVMPFIYQAGGDYLSADSKKALMDSDNTVEAFEFMHSMIYEHKVSNTANGNIVTPTTAMINDSTWFMGRDVDGNIGVATPLKYRKQTAQMHINKFAVSSTTKNPDLAWAFIEAMMEPRTLARLAAKSNILVPRMSAYRLEPYKNDPRWNTWLETAMMGTTLPGASPFAEQIASEFGGAIADILNNKVPARTRLQEFARHVNTNILGQGK